LVLIDAVLAAIIARHVAPVAYPWFIQGKNMVQFIFRSIGLCTVAAIILAPVWIFNGSLERLLPRTTDASHNGIVSLAGLGAAERFLDRFAIALTDLKREIREDACRHNTDTYFRLRPCPTISLREPAR
jgi:hypothetical protein